MNFLSTLGLCRKSGKLIHGFDPVCDELKNPRSKIAGVVIAKDVSEKTQKEMRFFCDKYETAQNAPPDLHSNQGAHSSVILRYVLIPTWLLRTREREFQPLS